LLLLVLVKAHRENLKEKWKTLGEEEKEPFERKQREHMAKQKLMKECITEALAKQKGGNCSRSYASLSKVRQAKFFPFYQVL
jgi:hypothetical protein